MNAALLAGALVLGPQGSSYIQPMGVDGYNVWSTDGLTTVRDYQGWQQIVRPDGTATNVIDLAPGTTVPALPIIPIDVGGEE